jgi:uncharacterized membrane protein
MTSRELVVVLLVVLGALVLLPALGMALGGFGMMGPGMMGPGMMGGWGHSGAFGWFGGLGLLALWLLVAGVLLIVLALTRRATPDGAPEILKQRLARGEITPEQYAELKRALQ